MVKKIVKAEPKAKHTKKVVEKQVVDTKQTPIGNLIKEDSNGDKHYAGIYSYSVFNAAGEKLSFDIDWNLLSIHMKELNNLT